MTNRSVKLVRKNQICRNKYVENSKTNADGIYVNNSLCEYDRSVGYFCRSTSVFPRTSLSCRSSDINQKTAARQVLKSLDSSLVEHFDLVIGERRVHLDDEFTGTVAARSLNVVL